jgi:hypothetical protein
MRLCAQVKRISVHLKVGLLTFLRGFLKILEASRLADALIYGIASILVLMPISFIGQGLNWALAKESIWIAISVVAVAAGLLLLFAALMTNEQFLRDIQLQGIKWPSLLSIALAWLAVLVFGGLSCGFERMGIVQIHPNVPFVDSCASKYADMYLWHLFDSIPGIKFTETVGWVQRYSYSDKLSGWLLVSFKVLVIISVIGSFVVCGRIRREKTGAVNASIQPSKEAET